MRSADTPAAPTTPDVCPNGRKAASGIYLTPLVWKTELWGFYLLFLDEQARIAGLIFLPS